MLVFLNQQDAICHHVLPVSHSHTELGNVFSSLVANVPLFRNKLLNNVVYLFKYVMLLHRALWGGVWVRHRRICAPFRIQGRMSRPVRIRRQGWYR